MANPQPEQFTRISNELYTAIMQTNFSKRQRKILDLVIRMSYGCGKKFAILRQQDFVDLVGIHKSDIRKELDQLQQAGVLLISENQITLNKDYESWQVVPARCCCTQRWQEVLNINLNPAKVGKTPKTEQIKVGEIPTTEQSKVGILPTESWCFTNQSVGKIPTVKDPPDNEYKPCEAPKEKVKENSKEKGIPPQPPLRGETTEQTIREILTQFPRYTKMQTGKLLTYWQMNRQNHPNGAISLSIVAKEMSYWERFPVGIVMEAIEMHLSRYQGKPEGYTAGIMRRLAKEKGGSPHGTHSPNPKPYVIDRSKFLWNGGKNV